MDVVLVLVLIWIYGMTTFKWIINESKLPWLKLDIEFPYQEMLKEAQALKNEFVAHRPIERNAGYRHKGWHSLCLHGISSKQTEHYTHYGYSSNEETPYIWTEIADACPISVKWLKNIYPCDEYYRVRFLLLEPRGMIAPHRDMDEHKLSPVNIALSHPKKCYFKMLDHGIIPFSEGDAFMLDVANKHAYINKSNQDRYHMIIHGNYKSNKHWKELIENSYKKNGIK